MTLIGSLIAVGSALAFLLVGALVWWGVTRALRREVAVGFRSRPPTSAGRVLALLAVALPAIGAALLALLAAARILLVAFGAG
jgi:hypothetical protein